MRRPCRADIKTAVEALDGEIAAANDYYETQVLPRLQAHEDLSGGSRRKKTGASRTPAGNWTSWADRGVQAARRRFESSSRSAVARASSSGQRIAAELRQLIEEQHPVMP